VNGAAIFLFVCVAGAAPGTPNFLCRQHPMPTFEACTKAIETMRFTPANATHDKESRVFAYCAPEGGFANEGFYKPKATK
jgi:hypothetical protein